MKPPVRWVSLGEYIEPCDERNEDENYGAESVRGLSTLKSVIETAANLNGVSLASYKLLPPKAIAYVPDTSRRGDRISLGMNETENTYLVSSISAVFRVLSEEVLDPAYLYLWFCRPEFDRYARFHSWGSAREAFSFDDMKRVRIPLPDIEVQKRIVAAWRGLRQLKEQNEALADSLDKLCLAQIEALRKAASDEKGAAVSWATLGEYIEPCDERNEDGMFTVDDVRGISIEKRIIPTKADMTNVSLSPYKIVHQKEFCFVTVTSRNGDKISLAENDTGSDCIVSSSYEVFRTHPEVLDPTYLYLWFCRPEFDRYARFHSWGSAREAFSLDEMKRVRIPLPDIEVQRRIAAVYSAAREARRIAAEAGKRSETICPALMRRVAEEAV